MRAAKPHVTDPELVRDLEAFSGQEGQHYRQHRRFNDVIRRQGFPGLRAFEDELEADYQRFTRTKSLRFNLAFAEGFEALTTAAARFSFESRRLGRMHPAVRELYTWHLIEEFEHRTVAFDVYEHVCGSYPYRLAVGLYAQWHTLRFVGRVAGYMLATDPGSLANYGGLEARRQRLRRQRRAALRGLLPKVLATWLPRYSPEKIAFTEEMKRIADRYSAAALGTS